jgi:hypothetical protein
MSFFIYRHIFFSILFFNIVFSEIRIDDLFYFIGVIMTSRKKFDFRLILDFSKKKLLLPKIINMDTKIDRVANIHDFFL